jgi:hypothetical protein
MCIIETHAQRVAPCCTRAAGYRRGGLHRAWTSDRRKAADVHGAATSVTFKQLEAVSSPRQVMAELCACVQQRVGTQL